MGPFRLTVMDWLDPKVTMLRIKASSGELSPKYSSSSCVISTEYVSTTCAGGTIRKDCSLFPVPSIQKNGSKSGSGWSVYSLISSNPRMPLGKFYFNGKLISWLSI